MSPSVSNTIFLINSHDNRTLTGFTYYLTVNKTNSIKTLKVSYLCVDADQLSSISLARVTVDTDFQYNCRILVT